MGAPAQPRSRAASIWRALARVAAKVVQAEDAGGVVYGVIVIGALLAAESGSHDGYAGTLESALIATCVYWAAHAYSNLTGRRLALGERLTARGLVRELGHDIAIVRGAAIPVLAVLVSWAAGAGPETAVTIALWCAVASIAGFELAAGIRSGASRGELALQLAAGIAMGMAIIALKVLLHK